MSFLTRIFSNKSAKTEEIVRLLQFNQRFDTLLNEDKYIARSDYKDIIEEYADIYTFFQNQFIKQESSPRAERVGHGQKPEQRSPKGRAKRHEPQGGARRFSGAFAF